MVHTTRSRARRLRLAIVLAAVVWTSVGASTEHTSSEPLAPQSEPPPLGTSVPRARLEPSESIPIAELEAFVDATVRHVMSIDRLVGAAVAVVQDDRVVLEKGYGFADLERGLRVDPRTTLFRIGSITKTFTWIAVMNAVESGRVELDDPVNDHLPRPLRIPEQGFHDPIRIRHLMTHRPGFEDRLLGHLFEREADDVRPLTAYLAEERPNRVMAPGRVSSYSNYGVALAGAVLEHLHGRPWQEIIESEIIDRLALAHTSAREPYPPRADLPVPMSAPLAAQLSNGYRWTGMGHVPRDFEYITQIAPAGAISSSAGDMARYMRLLLHDGALDGARIFGSQAAQAFRTPMTDLPPEVGNWAGGFWQTSLPGGFRNFGHDGGTMVFFSSMVLVPELRLGIFVATNTEGGANLSGLLAPRIVEHFYAPARQTAVRGSDDLAAEREVYEGIYLMTRRPYSGLDGFIFRLQALRVAVTADGFLVLPLLGRTHRFVPAEQPGEFRPVDETGSPLGGLVFRREEGRALRMDTFVMAFERVGPVFQPTTLVGLAAVTLLASVGTLLGVRVRAGRTLLRSRAQAIAAALHVTAAVAWLVSAIAVGVFAARAAADVAAIVYDFPPPALLLFSGAAAVATVLSVGAAVLLPAVWRADAGGGWTRWRKLRFTLATVTFVAFGALLALWGALMPW